MRFIPLSCIYTRSLVRFFLSLFIRLFLHFLSPAAAWSQERDRSAREEGPRARLALTTPVSLRRANEPTGRSLVYLYPRESVVLLLCRESVGLSVGSVYSVFFSWEVYVVVSL